MNDDLYVIRLHDEYLYWGWPEHTWFKGRKKSALAVTKARAEQLAKAHPGAEIEPLGEVGVERTEGGV